MRIAILGGSFNPVHVGHLFLADAVISALRYDRVILVPAFESPFKPGAEGASAQDRLAMLAASIAADPRLTIDDCEIRREGVSYTIDTIAEIKARFRPEGKPGLILGDDLAAAFSRWKRAADIADEADIIMARRLFGAAPQSADMSAALDGCSGGGAGSGGTEFFPYPYTELNNEIMNISSRLVREKIQKGENWRYLVPQGARFIIEGKGLYGCRASFGRPEADLSGKTDGLENGGRVSPEKGPLTETIAAIENAARNILSAPRFLHSRNTALMARDLCVRYGMNPAAGYLAGIAHDMCKSMEDKELIRLARLDGREMSALEKNKPGLLHGRAAAVLLREKYGVTQNDILDAVRFHVTCNLDMGDLAKVLYIADKLEISREWVPAAVREMSVTAPLDELFAAALGETVAFLRSNHKDISYGARRLLLAIDKKEQRRRGDFAVIEPRAVKKPRAVKEALAVKEPPVVPEPRAAKKASGRKNEKNAKG